MAVSYILLGSNLGNTLLNLQNAIHNLQQTEVQVLACSKVYQTKAWGNVNQDDFLNVVIKVNTDLNASELLTTLLAIELKMGRIRGEEKWMPRLIDLDILYFNDEIIDQQHLKIPHPYIADRRFTLIPLNDIAANYFHPQLKLSTQQLLLNCTDNSKVLPTSYTLSISNPNLL